MWASSKRVAGKAIKLTTLVSPSSCAGGGVTFQTRRTTRKYWRTIGKGTLVASGGAAKASIRWKPRKGTYFVRVRYPGGHTNVASPWHLIKVVVK